MIQFYTPDIDSSARLSPEESVHCVKVLRKKEGDEIFITNGRGTRYKCRITKASTRGVEFEILEREDAQRNRNPRIVLCVSPTKNADRMSWLVEKAVEVGVDEIRFLRCEHSERKNINIERLQRNAISAMNQSLKTVLPQIREIISLQDFIKINEIRQVFFGYCESEYSRERFVDCYELDEDVAVCIGPEGDFSPEEVREMTKAGYRAVTFGNERLRTETAALYSVIAIHVLNEKGK